MKKLIFSWPYSHCETWAKQWLDFGPALQTLAQDLAIAGTQSNTAGMIATMQYSDTDNNAIYDGVWALTGLLNTTIVMCNTVQETPANNGCKLHKEMINQDGEMVFCDLCIF